MIFPSNRVVFYFHEIWLLNSFFHISITREERDRDYYNDMPGKVPPDVGPPPVPPLPNLNRNISPEPRGEFLLSER